MLVNIKDITSALNKLSEQTNGEKNVPGVMFNITDNEMSVCYSDGHKAFIETVEVKSEDGDLKTKIVVPYEQIIRAIGNCQPSGNIVVKDIKMEFITNILRISATQELALRNTEGTIINYRKMATKSMDIPFEIVENTTDQKAKLLDRMRYSTIFEADKTDKWDRKKLISVLNTTSIEKGKNIYMSSKIQKVYVVNTAFTCAVPIEKNEVVTQEMLDELRGELAERDELSLYEEKAAKLGNTITFPVVMSTAMAKIISNILNKLPDTDDYKDVFLHVKDGYVCIFTSDEKVGIYAEQAKGSKMHTGSFERYNSLDYSHYQLTFVREFLADCIKSAVNSSKSEKTTFTFRENPEVPGVKEMVIVSQNSNASVSDTYNVAIDEAVDKDGTLLGTSITTSLKVFADMLGQLKSMLVALDISEEDNGQVCMRLAEIDREKVTEERKEARIRLGLPTSVPEGQTLPPLPDEEKIKCRTNTLDICQYSMIQR